MLSTELVDNPFCIVGDEYSPIINDIQPGDRPNVRVRRPFLLTFSPHSLCGCRLHLGAKSGTGRLVMQAEYSHEISDT